MNETKEVYFGDYCSKCEYCDSEESEYPCDKCLEEPFMYDSHKPMFWEMKK